MTEPKQALYRTFRTDKKIHWCFIGERVPSPIKPGMGILSQIATGKPNPLTQMPNIRATNGEAILFDIVTGHEDWRGDWPDSLLPQLLPKFKMGYTIAVMYACRTSGLNLAVQRRDMVQVSILKVQYVPFDRDYCRFSPAVSRDFTRWWTCLVLQSLRSAFTVKNPHLCCALAASSVLIVRRYVPVSSYLVSNNV